MSTGTCARCGGPTVGGECSAAYFGQCIASKEATDALRAAVRTAAARPAGSEREATIDAAVAALAHARAGKYAITLSATAGQAGERSAAEWVARAARLGVRAWKAEGGTVMADVEDPDVDLLILWRKT